MQIRDIGVIDIICDCCTLAELELLRPITCGKLDIVLTINGKEFDFEHMVLEQQTQLYNKFDRMFNTPKKG